MGFGSRKGLMMVERLNFTIKEYTGVEVYTDPDRKTLAQSLAVGDTIHFSGLFGETITMKVTELGERQWAESSHLMAYLEHKKDDRQCWVVAGLINKAAIDNIELKLQVPTSPFDDFDKLDPFMKGFAITANPDDPKRPTNYVPPPEEREEFERGKREAEEDKKEWDGLADRVRQGPGGPN